VPSISRREFLKFIAAGGIVAVAGISGVSSLMPKNQRTSQASAQTTGTWLFGPDALNHPVHVALLPSGKVLYVAGSGFHKQNAIDQIYKAGIWDPETAAHTEINLDHDLFCCGQTLLPDGKVLFVGGNLKYPFQTPQDGKWWGLNVAYIFNPTDETFSEITPMQHGRWYPTLVVLDDGRVQVVAGYDEFGYHNRLNEIFDPDAMSWSISYDPNASRTYCAGCEGSVCSSQPGAGDDCYGGTNQGVIPTVGLYPRMHLMPNGKVALVGQAGLRRVWNPATERWHNAGDGTQRSYGTSVLLPLQNNVAEPGKILVCGGSPTTTFPAISTNSADILTPTLSGLSLTQVPIASMTHARRYCNPVILPTGKIIIFGGTRESNDPDEAVFAPEMFDPEEGTWSELEVHQVPRIYHSGALLLQDGRVWTMGTSYDNRPKNGLPAYDLRTEIFSPDYVSQQRPVITGNLADAEYGGTITVQTTDASQINKVSLIKVSSTTHHYNTDQRLIWLQIDDELTTPSSITVSAPINSKLAPPGYYMLHIIDNNGVPSEGAMVKMVISPGNPVFYNVPSPGDTHIILKTGGDTRTGVEALTGSAIIGKSLKTWTVHLRRSSSASGTISAKVRKKSGDTIEATFTESLEAASLPTSFAPFVFTLNPPYAIKTNDRILIEYSGAASVYVQGWNSDKFDGSMTRRVKFSSITQAYSGGTAQDAKDTVGIMSSE
jgi:hypothetical protein